MPAELRRRLRRISDAGPEWDERYTSLRDFWFSGIEDATNTRMRRNRIDAAWISLQGVTYDISYKLGIDPTDRTITAVVRELFERGYIKIGPVRIADRLSRLYVAITIDNEPPTEETTKDFTIAAQNLKTILLSANAELPTPPNHLRTGQRSRHPALAARAY